MKLLKIAFFLALCLPVLGSAKDSANHEKLNDLLEKVRSHQQEQLKEFSKRESHFLEKKQKRKKILQTAKNSLKEAEQSGEQLKKDYQSNSKEIESLKSQLNKRSGDLNEVFGAARDGARELGSIARSSLVTVQYPERVEFLDKLASQEGQPTLTQLRQLWFEYMRQMVASGRVAEFRASVTHPDGRRETRDILRIGTFNAVSEGRYLRFDPDSTGLAMPPAQPNGQYRALAEKLQTHEGQGPVSFALDPTRGRLLDLLLQKPGLGERIQQGGIVAYIILALGVLGLVVVLERWVYLFFVDRKVQRQRKDLSNPKDDNPLGRILKVFHANQKDGGDTLEIRLDEAVLKETPSLYRGLPLVKLLASTAPMLGLLGTVVGIIETFQAITLFGTGDPKLMAGGISQALVTTAMGLSVAIPLVLLHSLVASRSRSLARILEEQSAGMVAENASGQEFTSNV